MNEKIMSKEFIYYRGIELTHWKSTMLHEKLNPLREALHLAPRDAALARTQYDQEVVSALRATNFSELDTNVFTSWFCIIGLSNTIKHIVLTCAGCGLVDVDANNQLVGEVNLHEE
ncbi:MAG: hypothetical protein H0U78_00870 [Rickettsiaceae bacterium]|nr:hypothetical protein [Rickettsiaceae bacterium]